MARHTRAAVLELFIATASGDGCHREPLIIGMEPPSKHSDGLRFPVAANRETDEDDI